MYIRRKVFSLLTDEYGEERYFSTSDIVMADEEERLFTLKETVDKAKKSIVEAGKKATESVKKAGKASANKVKEVSKKAWGNKYGKAAIIAVPTATAAAVAGKKIYDKKKKKNQD